VQLRLPAGTPIVAADDLEIAPGEHVLVTGPSGSGKSTLFRAIAGIWPFGEGTVAVAKGKRLLVLPQRPYLPFGRLDEALAYPSPAKTFSAGQFADVLNAVGLSQLIERLDEEAQWPHILSQGEQQRVSLARALLFEPDILLLDESTSALDEKAQAALYRLIGERLPNATVVSIGHRQTLHELHGRRLELQPATQTGFRLRTVA
jgi:vitamin B12/bleomycin/antimicrobial peptide transport system ATP-binding/permease protein